MSRKTGTLRSAFDGLAEMQEFAIVPIAAVLLLAVMVVSAVTYPFLTSVGQGEIVIKDCGDGDLTVWRHPKDDGIHWDGLCSVETYDARAGVKVKERMPSEGVDVTFRGTVYVTLPSDDAALLALHRAYGTQDAFHERAVMAGVMDDVRAAVADPAWREAKGNIIERKLKGALEYGMRRVSPNGAIWSSPEAKRALTEDIRRRISARAFPYGVNVGIELGFVVER